MTEVAAIEVDGLIKAYGKERVVDGVSFDVPAGTETGKLLRVKGRGAPKLRGGGKGDLLARVKVTVPQKLTKTEKEALEGYDKVLRERPRERFDRVARDA